MHPVTSVKGNRNAANGDLRVSLNVRGSTTSIASSVLISPARMPPSAVVFGSRMRSMLNLTAAASSDVPSWNLRFARSLSTNVRSSVCSHDSTRPGPSRPCAFTRSRVSWIARVAVRPCRFPVKCGSKVNGSAKIAAVRLPPRLMAAGAVWARPGRGAHRALAAPAVVAWRKALLVSMIGDLLGRVDGPCQVTPVGTV